MTARRTTTRRAATRGMQAIQLRTVFGGWCAALAATREGHSVYGHAPRNDNAVRARDHDAHRARRTSVELWQEGLALGGGGDDGGGEPLEAPAPVPARRTG